MEHLGGGAPIFRTSSEGACLFFAHSRRGRIFFAKIQKKMGVLKGKKMGVLKVLKDYSLIIITRGWTIWEGGRLFFAHPRRRAPIFLRILGRGHLFFVDEKSKCFTPSSYE